MNNEHPCNHDHDRDHLDHPYNALYYRYHEDQNNDHDHRQNQN